MSNPGGPRALAAVVCTVATALTIAALPADSSAAALSPGPAGPARQVAVVAADPHAGAAGPVVCDRFGSTPVAGGRYVVQNDRWGADDRQCIRGFDTGFEVTAGAHHNTTKPAGYPSIFTGCHYGACTTGTRLPRAVHDLGPLTTSWAFTAANGGSYAAAYDIWFDPTARRDGTVTGTEMMIWLRTTGPRPVGERTATASIGGTEWAVWRGDNSAQVISYVRTQPVDSVDDLDLTAFLQDAATRGVLPADWFLTSVQAGFEPWVGGAGLTTTAFSVSGTTVGVS